MFFSGASAAGGRAIYFEGTNGQGMLVRDCDFGLNETHVEINGLNAPTVLFLDRSVLRGHTVTPFKAYNSSNILTRLILNTIGYQDLVLPVCTQFASVRGLGATIISENCLLNVAQTASGGFLINNGARIMSSLI